MSEYARFGVRWYRIVEPALGSGEIFVLEDGGRYKRVQALAEGLARCRPRMSGLRLDVDSLWTELGRLGSEED